MADRETADIYETRAAEWVQRRSPYQLDRARAFAARAEGPSVDLGSGPGWYAPALPVPVVALDVATAMLELTATNAPEALRVRGDLVALPFRAGAFSAAWANHSYLHLPSVSLPMAFADVHRCVRVGGRFQLRVGRGESEGRRLRDNDDFPGRYFALWTEDRLRDVVVGAGFDVVRLETEQHANREESIEIEAVRSQTLPDFVGPELRMLVCGLNPSVYSADAGIGFARPGNRFWPAAIAAGVVSKDRDPWHALRVDRVGFTDLVKRATPGATELSNEEYRDGFARVERLVTWLQPDVVAFVGLAGWRAAVDRHAQPGLQPQTIGGRPAYVLPSTSGRNAHASLADLTEHLQRAMT